MMFSRSIHLNREEDTVASPQGRIDGPPDQQDILRLSTSLALEMMPEIPQSKPRAQRELPVLDERKEEDEEDDNVRIGEPTRR